MSNYFIKMTENIDFLYGFIYECANLINNLYDYDNYDHLAIKLCIEFIMPLINITKKEHIKEYNEHIKNIIDKWTSKLSYMLQKIFNINLIAICKSINTLTFNKPVYVSMCILYLDRVVMYKFHYDYFKYKYGNSLRLLFRDTDSVMYEIKTEKIYKD